MDTLTNPYRFVQVQGNIIFNFKIMEYDTVYRKEILSKTCIDFVNFITSSQETIAFIEHAAENDNSVLSIAGIEDCKPLYYYRNDLIYDPDNFIFRPHDKSQLLLNINITNFMLFKRAVDMAYTLNDIKLQHSIMPTPNDLLDFLNEGEQI